MLTFTQVLQGLAGTLTDAVHQMGLLQCQWCLPVCTAVPGVRPPAGKLTLWLIMWDQALVGEN